MEKVPNIPRGPVIPEKRREKPDWLKNEGNRETREAKPGYSLEEERRKTREDARIAELRKELGTLETSKKSSERLKTSQEQEKVLSPIYEELSKLSESTCKRELEHLTGLPIEKAKGRVNVLHSAGVLTICFENKKDFWKVMGANVDGGTSKSFKGINQAVKVDMRKGSSPELSGAVQITHPEVYGLDDEDGDYPNRLHAVHGYEKQIKALEVAGEDDKIKDLPYRTGKKKYVEKTEKTERTKRKGFLGFFGKKS